MTCAETVRNKESDRVDQLKPDPACEPRKSFPSSAHKNHSEEGGVSKKARRPQNHRRERNVQSIFPVRFSVRAMSSQNTEHREDYGNGIGQGRTAGRPRVGPTDRLWTRVGSADRIRLRLDGQG